MYLPFESFVNIRATKGGSRSGSEDKSQYCGSESLKCFENKKVLIQLSGKEFYVINIGVKLMKMSFKTQSLLFHQHRKKKKKELRTSSRFVTRDVFIILTTGTDVRE